MTQTSVFETSADAADRNLILAALPELERSRLEAHLELVTAEAGAVMAEPDQPPAHVWFPETATFAIASMQAPRGVDVSTVGREGMVGIAAFLGADAEPLRITCLVPGSAWRLPTSWLMRHASGGTHLERLLKRYALASLVGATQSAACLGLHSLDERCARWMLSVHDTAGSTPFPLTHQNLASSLGVRRAGATVAMRALRDAGAVQYTRGRVSIVDR
ncbi:MAG: Crp/Fnr family transcriptional regulator, partial [Gemmatimonadaceae bacterium]